MLYAILLQAKKKKKLFWVAAIAPLVSVILSTLIVYVTHANKHGVKIVSLVSSSLQKNKNKNNYEI